MPDRPTLLLLPGTLCDERLWAGVTPQLRQQVACQHIAWGGERTAAEAAARVLREAPPRFALAGMSMGGSVALEICAQAPQRVRALALISCQPRGDVPGSAQARAGDVAHARLHGIAALVRERLWSRYVHPCHLDDAPMLAAVLAMAQDAGVQAYETQHLLLASRRDHLDTLAALDVPVLVAGGDADQLCPPSAQSDMADRVRQAVRVQLSGCGHLSPLEAPQALAAVMAEWLSTLTGTA